ncbi:MCE family protein [Mycobacterium yunnanensis]|uniref:MCE family protein n=1 Tax=Mycobacterium yunnanensis TaxID=368477 RepID=A0A9X2Z5X7_9MYCO|nr:MCE family protein [Mycobacterium yunnanensis]MCV7423783.1 MCE family protein [Mycobacterium yunnanensis]
MPNKHTRERDPLRTGFFGITIITCLVLTSFGYTTVPFWPRGKNYSAYFTNAAGVVAGSDVQVYGYPVGKVTKVDLVDRSAKIDFTVDRKLRIGDQSLVAIKTDTVLGQRALVITPKGSGTTTSIPLGRTTTPYSLNNALQDLGQNVGDLDKPRFVEALQTLTDALHDATPQLRGALDGITALSRSVNARDEQVETLLSHANSVSEVLARRAEQINLLISDGNSLFTELDSRRQAINQLITGITDISRQISGFVADNRTEFGPALQKLNLVLDNLNAHREHIGEALKRLPGYSTALGEVVASAPGFEANIGGVPPPSAAALLFDTYFQPGKLPDSLADLLRGFLVERATIRPKSP